MLDLIVFMNPVIGKRSGHVTITHQMLISIIRIFCVKMVGKFGQDIGVVVNSSRSAEAPCSSENPVQLGPLVHLRPLTPCSAETHDSLFS